MIFLYPHLFSFQWRRSKSYHQLNKRRDTFINFLFFISLFLFIFSVEEEQKLDEVEAEEPDQDNDDDDDKDEDEGIDVGVVDPVDELCIKHSARMKTVAPEPPNPVQDDVLTSRPHLHLPGYEEVEQLALLLVKLADGTEEHMIPTELRIQISNALAALPEHDRSARSFVKRYESKWGYTLFGRCHGQESPVNSAAQKTKFSWMRYAQAAKITDESRLLYVVIKKLRNRPTVNTLSSPTKIAQKIKGQYRRIVDRVRDDRVLAEAQIPLPNINIKSITSFLNKEDKRANYLATVVPKAPAKQRVVSSQPIPDAPTLPAVLPQPNRAQVQYRTFPLEIGEKCAPKRKLDLDTADEKPGPSHALPTLLPKPSVRPSTIPKAPVLVIVPSQPSAASISFPSTSSAPFVTSPPAPPPPPKRVMSNPSRKPCAACGIFNCGGQRKRYRPSKEKLGDSTQKVFTFCNRKRKSLTTGFTDRVFDSYDNFCVVVDASLASKY